VVKLPILPTLAVIVRALSVDTVRRRQLLQMIQDGTLLQLVLHVSPLPTKVVAVEVAVLEEEEAEVVMVAVEAVNQEVRVDPAVVEALAVVEAVEAEEARLMVAEEKEAEEVVVVS